MKTLTANAQVQRDSQSAETVWIIWIDWPGNGTWSKYSAEDVSIGGVAHEGLIDQLNPLRISVKPNRVGIHSSLQLIFVSDTMDRFVDLSLDYVPEGKEIKMGLCLLNDSATTADIVWYMHGVIETVSQQSESGSTLEILDLSRKWTRDLPPDRVTTTDFPNAHPDDIGKVLPVIYGTVPNVPCLRAAIGGKTKLNGSIISTKTTAIAVDSTRDFPSSGTILIGTEEISYTSKTDTTFAGTITRGLGTTDPEDHVSRAEIIEVLTDYYYLAAGTACKDLSGAKVNGQPASPAPTYEKANTTLVSGKTLSVLKFADPPKSRVISENSEFLEMLPDAEGASNDCTDYAQTYDDPQSLTSAEVSLADTPLVVKQTDDMSDCEESCGEIVNAFLCIEFYTPEAFTNDSLQIRVVGETDWFDLFNVNYEEAATAGSAVPDRDRVHGHSVQIAGEHTHTVTDPTHPHVQEDSYYKASPDDVTVTGTTGSKWCSRTNSTDLVGHAVDGNPDTAAGISETTLGGYSQFSYLDCIWKSVPPKGKIKRIRLHLKANETGGTGGVYAYLWIDGGSKASLFSGAGAWVTGSWIDIESDNLDMDDLNNGNSYIRLAFVESGGSTGYFVYICYIDVEYVPTPSTAAATSITNQDTNVEASGDASTVVNFFDISSDVAQDWSWFQDKEIEVRHVDGAGDADGITGYVQHLWFEVEYKPSTEELGDQITCDVQGIESDGDGTGTLYSNPADVIQDIIVNDNLLDLTGGSVINAASFAAAKSSLASESAVFGFVLKDPVDALKLLGELSEMCRCYLRIECGVFYLDHRPDSLGAAVADITPYSRIEFGELRALGMADVWNLLRSECELDPLTGAALSFYESADATSQTAYGIEEREKVLWALRTSYAETVLDFMLAQHKDPRMEYLWRETYPGCDLTLNDIVDIGDEDWNLLHAKGQITDVSITPGDLPSRQPDIFQFRALLETGYSVFWNGGTGTLIRIYDGDYFFMVDRALVARLTAEGVFYIKGFIIEDPGMPASTASPLLYDSDRRAIAFALSVGATPSYKRVMELDYKGNIHLLASELPDQGVMTPGGTEDSIESDTTLLWVNSGAVRIAEVTATGFLKLPGHVVENEGWLKIYG